MPSRDYFLRLLEVCGECECDFDCYCASNAEWAERELAKLTRAQNAALTADGGKPCDTARVAKIGPTDSNASPSGERLPSSDAAVGGADTTSHIHDGRGPVEN